MFYIPIKAQGIIIADDIKQEQLFNSVNEQNIISFANDIASKYKQVIFHLGRSYVFQNGNIFGDAIAKKNLNIFCSILKQKNIILILWFFDSYGDISFTQLYKDHVNIINENLDRLNELNIPFDGIAVDMEWINKGGNSNNIRYLDIIKYLRSKVLNKKIYCFASLLNDEHSNSERGYDVQEILKYADNMIDMLYLQEGDFFIFNAQHKLQLNIDRIATLRNYCSKQGWLIAVSLQAGILMENEDKTHISLLPDLVGGYLSLLNISKVKHKSRNKLSKIYEYKIISTRSFNTVDNTKIEFHRKQRIFYFVPKANKIVRSKDFIWEYFLIKAA